MTRSISAVYDAGVFRPLEPVDLAQGTHVELKLELATTPGGVDLADETKKSWNEYLDRMESLPDNSPDDGLTNRDHDRIIYGS
jgi:predicted DNA-binding antitoxin AbrB/MazE fold protein